MSLPASCVVAARNELRLWVDAVVTSWTRFKHSENADLLRRNSTKFRDMLFKSLNKLCLHATA